MRHGMHVGDQGVLSVEILHPLGTPSQFFDRLQHTVARATMMRAAIAFWTLEPGSLLDNFASLLSNPDSFLCVDLHLPTSVIQLAALARQIDSVQPGGVRQPHLYLHVRDLEGLTEAQSANTAMPKHLLHAKTVLFDLDDKTAEIWIGSHNWTRRAIVGLNIEMSTVIQVSRQSPLYAETRSMLEATRCLCQPFDPHFEVYYKWLQGSVYSTTFVEMEGPDANSLEGQEIKLFGFYEREITHFRTTGQKFCLSIRDSATDDETIYKAKISTSSSSVEDIRRLSRDLVTSKQRYAVRQGMRLPFLEPPGSATVLSHTNQIGYCVTIAVERRLPRSTRVYNLSAEEQWVDVEDDPFLMRLWRPDGLDVVLLERPEYAMTIREILAKVTIRLPATAGENFRQPYTRQLADLRADTTHALFTRKLIELDPTP